MKLKKMVETRELRLIDISLLQELKNDRQDETEDDLDFLATSFEDSGLLEPLAVAGPYPNGHYKVISGIRRLHALKLRYQEELDIPCYVVANSHVKEEKLLRMRAETHLTTKKADEYSTRLLYCEMLAKEYGASAVFIKEMQRTTGLSERYCRSYRDVIKYGSKYLKGKLFIREGIRVMEAARIARSAPNDEYMQKQILDNFLKTSKEKRNRVHLHGERRPMSVPKRKKVEPIIEVYPGNDAANAIHYLQRICTNTVIAENQKQELLQLCITLAEKLKEEV